MKKILSAGVGVGLLASCLGMAMTEDLSSIDPGPPKVLVIQREWLKPGRGGTMHEKSESAFVNAMTAAKWPTHYFAAESMSGRPRVLFISGYPSFEAWEKDNHAMEKNAALSAAVDHAMVSDGDLLSSFDQGVFTLDEEGSLNTGPIVHSRYFEITKWMIKPGHRAEWMELVKLYHDGFAKVAPNANWALYESQYGEDNGGLYIALSKTTSLAEDDAGMNDGKKFSDLMGASGMKKVRELTASCVESVQTNLYSFNPKMSYVGADWMNADPFWKPKPATMAKKPAAPANP